MKPTELFELVDEETVRRQVNLGKESIRVRRKNGEFPEPIGGMRHAFWAKIQINDYLYQLLRYGKWSPERAMETIESAHEYLFVEKTNKEKLKPVENDEK